MGIIWRSCARKLLPPRLLDDEARDAAATTCLGLGVTTEFDRGIKDGAALKVR
jgi:hypothetical protein